MTINCSTPNTVSSASPNKRFTDLISALNSTETMQKSVMNAFALKYSKAMLKLPPPHYAPPPTVLVLVLFTFVEVSTGRSEIPYDSLQNLGVQVYGMPTGIPFHSPLLYNQQQLQQILANLEKIVFLKVPQVKFLCIFWSCFEAFPPPPSNGRTLLYPH